MKVYIVMKAAGAGRDAWIVGVYSNKNAAKAMLDKMNAADNSDYEIIEEYVED